MDYLKGIDKRPWICNEKINVKQFLVNWESQGLDLELNLKESTLDEVFMRMTSSDEEILNSVKEDTASQALIKGEDSDWKDCLYGYNFTLPSHVKLNSVLASTDHIEKCSNDQKYRTCASQILKYKHFHFLNESKKSANRVTIDGTDVILNVQVYQPMHHFLYVGDHRKHVAPIVEQEFLCLGQLPLTALKSEIICPVDASPAHDCSDDPHASKPSAGDLYTSSFFFINDTFYNDLRSTSNIDYSQVIIDWAKNRARNVGPLDVANMDETRFIDLTIRLGQPYVYVHQGNCEHMIVFSELRLFSPQTDSPFLEDYPKIFKTTHRNSKKCLMCRLNVAKWLVFGNKRLPEEPYFFCEQCFLSFNYDAKNKKIGQFKAYRYLDKSAIL